VKWRFAADAHMVACDDVNLFKSDQSWGATGGKKEIGATK